MNVTMAQIFTADTAFFYSCLELDHFDDSSGPWNDNPKDHEDLFSETFSEFLHAEPDSMEEYGGSDSLQCSIQNQTKSISLGDISDVQVSLGVQPQNGRPNIEEIEVMCGAAVQIQDVDTSWSGSRIADTGHESQCSSLSEDKFHSRTSGKSNRKTVGRPRSTLTEEVRERKHKAFLERNRIAAGKCRKRKKERVDTLEGRSQEMERRNVALKEMLLDLTGQIESIRSQLCSTCHPQEETCRYKIEDMIIDDRWEVMETKAEGDTILPLGEEIGRTSRKSGFTTKSAELEYL